MPCAVFLGKTFYSLLSTHSMLLKSRHDSNLLTWTQIINLNKNTPKAVSQPLLYLTGRRPDKQVFYIVIAWQWVLLYTAIFLLEPKKFKGGTGFCETFFRVNFFYKLRIIYLLRMSSKMKISVSFLYFYAI